ncbi:hypothetical protein [uncultured Vagococcus sp.]|uniref:hypothetical protein n=1 Tax=uncultured Vagococcus sp. TaxID=189676 RepID=UPI0028D18A09|nr:hypothetical protein [uncultured Vagococcus sp.]
MEATLEKNTSLEINVDELTKLAKIGNNDYSEIDDPYTSAVFCSVTVSLALSPYVSGGISMALGCQK